MPDLNTAYSWAINTCDAPNVGYSQTYRNQQQVNGITYYDCSSFIWYALKAGGFDVEAAYQSALGYAYTGNAITTSSERSWLLALGFHEVANIATAEWQAGDILWRSGHTEMVYTGGVGQGVTMGAHTSNTSLANQVSINSSATPASKWTSLYRYGNDPAQKEGISIEVISAICGNWYHESNINPGIYEGLQVVPLTDNSVYGGYGLGQWTNNSQVHRRTELVEWLRSNGYADDSGEGQLEYMIVENVWYPVYEASAYTDLHDFLYTSDTNIADLTHAFCRGWEGIHDASWDDRVTYANQCYNYILAHAQDSSINTWYKGNNWLNTNQILNNAVLVYRYLNDESGGGGGGGGGSVIHPTHMPIWMALRRF